LHDIVAKLANYETDKLSLQECVDLLCPHEQQFPPEAVAVVEPFLAKSQNIVKYFEDQ